MAIYFRYYFELDNNFFSFKLDFILKQDSTVTNIICINIFFTSYMLTAFPELYFLKVNTNKLQILFK